MYFLNGNGMELVNSDYIERLCVVVKSDAALVVASYDRDRQPVTLARYKDEDAAKTSLIKLQIALPEGNGLYAMDENMTCIGEYRPRNGYHGKKQARHGGS